MAAAAQLVTIPTVATELNTHFETHTVLAYEETVPVEKASTETTVRTYFKDIPVLAEIARCESDYTQIEPTTGKVMRGAQNPNDVGVMQINTRYHGGAAQAMGLDLYTLEGNMAYARTLYEREGTRPWNASRACWEPKSLAMR